MPSSQPNPLNTLRDQIKMARAAADQIARDGFNAEPKPEDSATSGSPPKQGYNDSSSDTSHNNDADHLQDELRSLTDALYALRTVVPKELEIEVVELLRQVLLITRTIVDHWINRLDQYPAANSDVGQQTKVEPIPVR